MRIIRIKMGIEGRKVMRYRPETFFFILGACWCSYPTTANAQEASSQTDEDTSIRSDNSEIIVTGTSTVSGRQVGREARLGLLGTNNIFETPFSVKSLTDELIKNQGVRTVDELLTNDPSIRTALSPTGRTEQSAIRGFVVFSNNYLFDGLPFMVPHITRPPVAHYERVDVIKGPNTGFTGGAGNSSTGGAISYVPKRAEPNRTLDLNFSFRDESSVFGHVDFGERFGSDQIFGARVNASVESGQAYNDTFIRNVSISSALDVRSGPFRAVLDLLYVDYANDGGALNFSLSAIATLPSPPRPEIGQIPKFIGVDHRVALGLLSLEYDFAPGWTIAARGGINKTRASEVLPAISTLNGDGSYRVNSYNFSPFDNRRTALEGNIRGKFDVLGIDNRLVLSLSRFTGGVSEFGSGAVVPVNANTTVYVVQPFANPFPNGEPPRAIIGGIKPEFVGFTIGNTFSAIDDRLQISVVGRYQKIRNGVYNQDKWSPTVAGLFKLTRTLSIYGNYAEGLTQGAVAPSTAVNANEQLSPFIADQKEVGIKWNAGRFGITAAYFDIAQESAFTDPVTNIFTASGLQRNKGFEIEAFGEPVKGLRILGGASYVDGRQERTRGGLTDGNRALGVTDWGVSASVEWDIPSLAGVTVTGRYIHTGDAFVNLTNTQGIPSWDRVDLGARYRFDVGGTPIVLRANLTNLFDKSYWQTASRNLISVAAPRVLTVSASAEF
jgi:iron complex outermembrane recepter protein